MKPITILVADDEKEIAELIQLHLEREGYRVIKAFDGKEAMQAVQTHSIDLAILDVMMPGADGHDVTRQIREQHAMPIIFVSAKTSDMDKITGLVLGADDYMTKPFNPMELVARVNAQLRRSMRFNQLQPNAAVIEAGGLIIDLDKRTVELYGQMIELTPKEFDILALLAGHSKKVFSVENIFQQVWGEAYYEGSTNTVMVHIRSLRKKLGEDTNKNKLIKTVWGVGYTFNG